jgi:hypothetical protein
MKYWFIPLLLIANPAMSEEAKPRPTVLMDKVIGEGQTYACFSRTYDKDHLASHPHQNVRSMKVFLEVMKDNVLDDAAQHIISVRVGFRGLKGEYDSSGSCLTMYTEPEKGSCGIDCDGGHLAVSMKDDKSILVETSGVRLTDGEDEDGAPKDAPKKARFGSDDKVFRLDRVAAKECLPLIGDEDLKKTIARGK